MDAKRELESLIKSLEELTPQQLDAARRFMAALQAGREADAQRIAAAAGVSITI